MYDDEVMLGDLELPAGYPLDPDQVGQDPQTVLRDWQVGLELGQRQLEHRPTRSMRWSVIANPVSSAASRAACASARSRRGRAVTSVTSPQERHSRW